MLGTSARVMAYVDNLSDAWQCVNNFPGVCLRLDLTCRRTVAREGASDFPFRRGWMLELCLEERNTVVLLEINFEHFYRDPKLNLDSNTNNTNCCAQNLINH